MYYPLYGALYLLSLLPLSILYLLGDGVYVILYYLSGYRRKVVMQNLTTAFPEKTVKEKEAIAKQFYHNFVDTFIETIKLLSMSEAQVLKRVDVDLSAVDAAIASGKNVQLQAMHNFNWEMVNLCVSHAMKIPFLGIYMPIGSPVFEKIMCNLRTRYGTVLIPATKFKTSFEACMPPKYVLAMAADQNPSNPSNALWLNFFGKPTGFVSGPERSARAKDYAIVFVTFYKVKRGYYKVESSLLTSDVNSMPQGALTLAFVRYVEQCIRKRPHNYLWTHKRWKREWKDEYRDLWIDDEASRPLKNFSATSAANNTTDNTNQG